MITEKIKNNWRKIVSSIFILSAFLMPTTRDLLSKMFDVTTFASNNNNNNNQNNKNDTKKNDTKSVSQKTVSCPDSLQDVSPMQNGNNVSKDNHSHSSNKNDKPKSK